MGSTAPHGDAALTKRTSGRRRIASIALGLSPMAVRRDGAKSTYDRGLGRRIGDAAPRRTQEPGLHLSEHTGLLQDFLRGITGGMGLKDPI